MENNELIGIVIDPGHGGEDSGAIGNNQYEKDYTLKISKYMYDRLRELGVPVTLTRDADVTLTPMERVNRILSAYGDDSNVIVISNHLNAGGGTGAEVIYALRNSNTLPESVLKNLSLAGQTIRKAYQRTLPSNPEKDYYFIHRNTGNTQPLIVEYGFIDDTPQQNQFLNNNYKELAEAVIKSILEYKNLPYSPPKTNSQRNYIVKKGDTLYSIAQRYNITVDELKKQNQLSTNQLTIGQSLILPSTSFVTYTVQKGDTLYKIASQYNTTVDILKKINNLSSNILSIGQKIKLPSTEIINIPASLETYTVKSGDTLYSIAKKFDTTVDKIKSQNSLSADALTVGQVLKIPSVISVTKPSKTNVYTVEPGDTLYSLAREFNTTVNNLKSLNNLITNNLVIGQTIITN
ncbi:MAG: LysM peptidoglycan-binding domain-containing protein [Bacilli bacterium]|nr:LysM peptidoglycan-binding domain-containing protein [Bacilli bacterium]